MLKKHIAILKLLMVKPLMGVFLQFRPMLGIRKPDRQMTTLTESLDYVSCCAVQGNTELL